MEVKKIKDWLKERSGKQFKLINGGKTIIRLKDNVLFSEGKRVKIGETDYTILRFERDGINVILRAENGPLKNFWMKMEANKLERIYKFNESAI